MFMHGLGVRIRILFCLKPTMLPCKRTDCHGRHCTLLALSINYTDSNNIYTRGRQALFFRRGWRGGYQGPLKHPFKHAMLLCHYMNLCSDEM